MALRGDRFAWWFDLGEEWLRGQLSSLMMLTELGEPGAWSRVFNQPNLAKFSEPTVSGVDYPTRGLAQCWMNSMTGNMQILPGLVRLWPVFECLIDPA